eukprot:GHVQ01031759.1.p1 GENE.GHVQ01031759.1~~GHVQ01031759.1.p1  ORF type:complete len:339 (-),score=22.31 GHVQ01031759.1:4-1020(-)
MPTDHNTHENQKHSLFPPDDEARKVLQDTYLSPHTSPGRCQQIFNLKRQALAPNSIRTYNYALSKIRSLPITTPGEAMNNLLDLQGLSQRCIALTLTAITRWHHERNLPPPPLTHPHVCDLIKALNKTGNNRTLKAAPFVDRSILMNMLRYWTSHSTAVNTFTNIRNAAFFTIQLWGMTRFSEVANLKPENVVNHDNHITVTIAKSKTDQVARGTQVIIPRESREGIPLAKIITRLKHLTPHDTYLLPSISYEGRVNHNIPISNTAWNLALRKAYQLVAPCPTHPPSSHSLRKSAARLLTDNGISPDIIHEIGRWKSDAHFVYTSPSDSKRLDVIADI